MSIVTCREFRRHRRTYSNAYLRPITFIVGNLGRVRPPPGRGCLSRSSSLTGTFGRTDDLPEELVGLRDSPHSVVLAEIGGPSRSVPVFALDFVSALYFGAIGAYVDDLPGGSAGRASALAGVVAQQAVPFQARGCPRNPNRRDLR